MATAKSSEKSVLVSGIQPSGRLHIGNYLGALKNFVDLQNSEKYHCYFFLADLHSLTEESTPKEKQAQILNLTADYLAAGLDTKQSTIFQQSQISSHSELSWILSTVTPIGELERMTQYKDKSARQMENVNVGLFTYPVLMAAVPVRGNIDRKNNLSHKTSLNEVKCKIMHRLIEFLRSSNCLQLQY